MTWKTIDTAPAYDLENEKPFLIWLPKARVAVTAFRGDPDAYQGSPGWFDLVDRTGSAYGLPYNETPTHWQEAPAGPEGV